MHSYEVEIKSLLGSSERADEVREKMQKLDPSVTLHSKNKQLNHYFTGGTLQKLATVMRSHLSDDANTRLDDLAKRAKEFSVRTRDKDPDRSSASDGAGGTVLLVVKASVDDTTSANGIARMEFEEKVSMTLDELDKLVLSAGFSYEAKWSREREEYVCKSTNVTLDKNAGYGWLAEFERVITDESKLEEARNGIRALMQELGVEELPQERLARMFDYYNMHWLEYYGTDKIFVLE
ncbi:MAG: CYTH domain-containing protein [Patescibacteria group bacterium]